MEQQLPQANLVHPEVDPRIRDPVLRRMIHKVKPFSSLFKYTDFEKDFLKCPFVSGADLWDDVWNTHDPMFCNACVAKEAVEKNPECLRPIEERLDALDRYPCLRKYYRPLGGDGEPCDKTKDGAVKDSGTAASSGSGTEVVNSSASGAANSNGPGVANTNGPGRKRKRERVESDAQEERLPDGLAISRLKKKMNLTKGDAVKKFVEEKREKAKQHQQENQEEVAKTPRTSADQMPWVPNTPPFPNFFSVIESQEDHRRYVSIAINLLKEESRFRFAHNKLEIQHMDELLKDEREKFQSLVIKNLSNRKKPIFLYGSQNWEVKRYVLARQCRRRAALKGLYTIEKKIERSNVGGFGGESSSECLPKLKVLLNAGKIVKLLLPDEKKRFAFPKDVEEVRAKFPLEEANKCPIEKDDMAARLALKYGVRVVMGVSSAVALIAKPSRDTASSCIMPLVVKEFYSDVTGRLEKVCVVGKPCVDTGMTEPTIWRQFVKIAVKSAISPEVKPGEKTGGRQRAKLAKLKDAAGQKDRSAVSSNSENRDCSADEGGLMIDTASHDDTLSSNMSTGGAADVKIDSGCSSKDPNDLFGNILDQMDIAAAGEGTANGVEDIRELSEMKGADIRKRYAIFSLGHDGIQDVDVLIRSNNDGVDASGNTLAVTFKLEYAPYFGAERISNEEFVRDFFRCKFKDASQLIRFRIHFAELFFLQKERAYVRNLLAEDMEKFNLMKERTELLKSAVIQLELLPIGSYVLRVNEDSTVDVMSQTTGCDSSEPCDMEIGSVIDVLRERTVLPMAKLFQGIDEHVVLQQHMIQKQIPAAFQPKKEGSKTFEQRRGENRGGGHRSHRSGNRSRGGDFGNRGRGFGNRGRGEANRGRGFGNRGRGGANRGRGRGDGHFPNWAIDQQNGSAGGGVHPEYDLVDYADVDNNA